MQHLTSPMMNKTAPENYLRDCRKSSGPQQVSPRARSPDTRLAVSVHESYQRVADELKILCSEQSIMSPSRVKRRNSMKPTSTTTKSSSLQESRENHSNRGCNSRSITNNKPYAAFDKNRNKLINPSSKENQAVTRTPTRIGSQKKESKSSPKASAVDKSVSQLASRRSIKSLNSPLRNSIKPVRELVKRFSAFASK